MDLPFSEGDRVAMDDRHGRVVTFNHDDPDHVIFLVAFDEPLHEKDGDDDITVRTVWVGGDYLELVESGVDWAKRRLGELAAGPFDHAAVSEMAKVRALHDKWAGVDPQADALRARASRLLAGVVDGVVAEDGPGPGHD